MGGVSLNALYNEVALGRWVERKVLELSITPLVGADFARACVAKGAGLRRWNWRRDMAT